MCYENWISDFGAGVLWIEFWVNGVWESMALGGRRIIMLLWMEQLGSFHKAVYTRTHFAKDGIALLLYDSKAT
jgi:hypothetical protein